MKTFLKVLLVGMAFSIKAQALPCWEILSKQNNPASPAVVKDLTGFLKAMTQGMLLHLEQQELHSVYLRSVFGDSSYPLDQKSLKTIYDALEYYPDISKPDFREYEFSKIERTYEVPPSLEKFILSMTRVAGRVRNNLFEMDANRGFWLELLAYQAPQVPESLVQMQKQVDANSPDAMRAKFRLKKAKFAQESKQQSDKFWSDFKKLHRVGLVQVRNKSIDYVVRAQVLFEILKLQLEKMESQRLPTKVIRQAMVDLIFTVGFGNTATLDFLKSPNGLLRVAALNKIWAEAHSLAEVVGYQRHFSGMKNELLVEHPTGLSKNIDLVTLIKGFEKEVLSAGPLKEDPPSEITTGEDSQIIRIRALSLHEAPFRSCLGSDCATRVYFERALDPNYIYFTMTDSKHFSSGHASLVLGTARDSENEADVKVAFLDKLQNIPTYEIEIFLAAISRSLNEEGYKLVIPTYLGKDLENNGGLSNMDVIVDFVQSDILARLSKTLEDFTPHPHRYKSDAGYSRADQKLQVQVFQEGSLIGVEINPGRKFVPYLADKDLGEAQLFPEFAKLRKSNKPQDLEKYIDAYEIFLNSSFFGRFHREDYIAELNSIWRSKTHELSLRKKALYTLAYIHKDSSLIINGLDLSDPAALNGLAGEIENYKKSKNPVLKFMSKAEWLDWAITNEHFDFATRLLKIGVKIDLKDRNGNSFLHRAVLKNQFELTKLLIENGADVNEIDRSSNTALHLATEMNCFEIAKFLVENKASVEMGNISGRPLHTAIRLKNFEMAKLLLENGANIEAMGWHNTSPLSLAIQGNDERLVRLLVDNGVEVNSEVSYKFSALLYAIELRREKIAIILIESGAKIDQPDRDGNSAIHWALGQNLESLAILLIKNGADIRKGNSSGTNAFHFSASRGLIEVARFILENKSVVNSKDHHGNTGLHWAVGQRKVDLVKLILEYKPDVNALDRNGYTPLHLAAATKNVEIGRLLINAGAKLDILTFERVSLHDLARGSSEFLDLLQ